MFVFVLLYSQSFHANISIHTVLQALVIFGVLYCMYLYGYVMQSHAILPLRGTDRGYNISRR